jgi:hypothetical protein
MRIAAYLQDELTNSTDEQYDAIKNAGWNTLILGLIHVEAPNPYNNPPIYGGTLYFNGGKAFEYGEYTGTPDFTDRVNGLIKGGTIRTLLASVGGGSPPDYDFTNIQRLYETRQDPQRGAGWSSLQSNFRALRETFPSIAMIDMDNEELYDLPSFVAFCQMIIGIGYDITFSPFSDQSEFWNPALAQLEESNPSSVKWWNLQCYGPTLPTDRRVEYEQCLPPKPSPSKTRHQHHPHALGRRRAERQLRPSRHAHGRRRHGLHALDKVPEVQPERSALVRPRPLHPLRRPRLDAALQPAASDRLRPPARRTEALPPVRAARRPAIPNAITRPASKYPPGPLGQGSATRWAWPSPKPGSPQLQQARPHHRRSPHLHDLRRWLPHGRHHAGSRLARRPSAARQTHRVLRSEPHHARRRQWTSPSPKTCRSASRPTAGTRASCRWQRRRRYHGRHRRSAGEKPQAFAPAGSHTHRLRQPKKQDNFSSHGSPLGEDELLATKKALGWPSTEKFFLPEEAVGFFRQAIGKGAKSQEEWNAKLAAYKAPTRRRRRVRNAIAAGKAARRLGRGSAQMEALRQVHRDARGGRRSPQRLSQTHPQHHRRLGRPEPFHQHRAQRPGRFSARRVRRPRIQGAVGGVWGYNGRNVAFGVREHAMGAAVNGMAAHGGILPFSATFFVFSDYMKPALRLGALMKLKVFYVFTHDSIGVGEDGPTHEPVEQLAGLRAIPGLTVIRPPIRPKPPKHGPGPCSITDPPPSS